MIKVKAKNPDTVALWERNTEHPAGEVYITGNKVFEVAKTGAVVNRLNSGALIEVKEEKPAPKRPARKKKAAK